MSEIQELKSTLKPLTDKEIEVKRWVEELKKDCPEVHPYFIEHLAKAYQINPKKFDDIIENNVRLDNEIERISGGELESVKVYNSLEELELAEKKSN
jgi:hypothetical protein